MAKRFRLRELEQKYGDLHNVIPPLVNKLGQKDAAARLGLSQATISEWLKDNDYKGKTEYVRKDDQQPEVQS